MTCKYENCKSLTSITIPNSVVSIGDLVFCNCSTLASITIPESVKSIGSFAFYRTKWYDNQPNGLVYAGKVLYEFKGSMPSDTKIDIQEGTVGIASYAFSICSGLTSIIIPNSVTSIGYGAFSGCSGLTSVTILAENPPIMDGNSLNDNVTIHVLPGCKAKYEAANSWQNYNIVEDVTTGIDIVKGSPTISPDKIFSISGQQLYKTQKGVNIINGKKILVK